MSCRLLKFDEGRYLAFGTYPVARWRAVRASISSIPSSIVRCESIPKAPLFKLTLIFAISIIWQFLYLEERRNLKLDSHVYIKVFLSSAGVF